MNKAKTIIGLDVGHSRVKVVVANTHSPAERNHFSFLTLVSNWTRLSDDASAAQAEKDTVEVDGRRFFVGQTVLLQENPQAFMGVHFDWFEKLSPQYGALTKAAFQKARRFIAPTSGEILVIAGLPSEATKENRAFVRALTMRLLTPLMQMGETLKVSVVSQASAPIFHVLFGDDGAYNPNFRQDAATVTSEINGEVVEKDVPATTYGVIEVGHLTTDYTVLAGLYGIENASVSTPGVYKTFEKLQAELRHGGFYDDLNSVTNALIERAVDGQDVAGIVKSASQNLIDDTVSTAKEAFSNRRLDGILVAGGGASLVFGAVKALFPKAEMIKNSRLAVAEGYVRLGLAKTMEQVS